MRVTFVVRFINQSPAPIAAPCSSIFISGAGSIIGSGFVSLSHKHFASGGQGRRIKFYFYLQNKFNSLMDEPSVFLFRETNEFYELYLGQYTTSKALRLFDPHKRISIEKAGGTDLSKNGWFTDADFSEILQINQLIEKLDDPNLDFVDLEINIKGFGILTTHDDGECHFRSIDRTKIITLVEKAITKRDYLPLLITLNEHQNKYIVYQKSNNFTIHDSFEDYLKNSEIL